MREGSLDQPQRHPLAWTEENFYNEAELDQELRRVFDICHGCRRCFNLCNSFPRLFDLIDESESGELESVESTNFKRVVDDCTLCDMCFMTKCPYVPPHEFNLDFPHLMLRYRAVEYRNGKVGKIDQELANTDRNGKAATKVSTIVNWASDTNNRLTRTILEKFTGIDSKADLPNYHSRTFQKDATLNQIEVNNKAPAYGRKAVLYATCFANFNSPEIGVAARNVLALNGVATEIVYPSCCGMPQLEHGNISAVANRARQITAALSPWVEKGYDVVGLIPSCALMIKSEWPLILPNDGNVTTLSKSTFDISEYIVDIAKTKGLVDGLMPLDGGVAIHFACHSRAQNMGAKAAEMMRLLPDTDLTVIDRCSGHGGTWGIKKKNFETAITVGRTAARQTLASNKKYVVSECPLAGRHLLQGVKRLFEGEELTTRLFSHPIVLFARAYGIDV